MKNAINATQLDIWINTIGLTSTNITYSYWKMYLESTHLKSTTYYRSKQAKLIVRLIPLESFELIGIYLKKCVQRGLKKCDCTRYMDMNDNVYITTLPKRGLKTRSYNMDMNKEDHITTSPKRGLKTRSYKMDMEKKDLKKLSKLELIKMPLKQKKSKKVGNHEDLLDNDPFEDEVPQPITLPQKPTRRIPKPTRKPPPPPMKEHITDVPSKIKELSQALKGHAKSYGIELQDNFNLLNHFKKTRPSIESDLEDLLKTMKGFKFIETLEVTFEKQTINSKTGECVSIYKTVFFNGKAKTITKTNDIEQELSMSREEMPNMIDKWVSEGSGWVIDRIDSTT